MRSIQRIVVVMSTNYAGSHLLSHLLSAHPDAFGVGELHRYHTLIDDDVNAPVIAEYTENPIYEGLAEHSIDQWHRTIGTRVAAAGARGDSWLPVIVDNSKKVKWVEQIAHADHNEICLVHLVRDPRALVARWLNTYTTRQRRRTQRLRIARRMPGSAFKVLRGSWETVFTYKWLRENLQIADFLARSPVPSATVTYRDLAFEAESALGWLMPKLNMTFDEAQLRFGESDTLGTTKTAHAESVSRSEIKPDLKWQNQLSDQAQEAIINNPDVQAFLQRLSLEGVADGLTQL